jgi:hypothetical protein
MDMCNGNFQMFMCKLMTESHLGTHFLMQCMANRGFPSKTKCPGRVRYNNPNSNKIIPAQIRILNKHTDTDH